MVAPTRSSKPARNGRAAAALLVGFLAAATVPTAIALAEYADRYDLVQAGWSAPIALALGLLAVVLSRRARRRVERTLGRVGGERIARIGRSLGVLGIMLGLSGAIAIGVYLVLTRVFVTD